MEILTKHTYRELIDSLHCEIAKASNEIKTAQSDIKKAQNRIAFSISIIKELKQRPTEE